jgi:ribonuclease VapC
VIVDSSAVLAILFAEADAADFASAIETAEVRRMSAANWLETAIRVDQGGDTIASKRFPEISS